MLWVHARIHGPHGLEGRQAIDIYLQANTEYMEFIPVHDLDGAYRLFSVGSLSMAVLEG